MFKINKFIVILIAISGMFGFFSVSSVQAATEKPDLTVTSITFSGASKGETGKLSVTIKNLGGNLNSSAGLLNHYNNFSYQNFIFDNSTPSATQFKTDRSLPTTNYPLRKNDSITFYWYGSFNTLGNLYLQFKVDNANELAELNEDNNSLSSLVTIKEQTKKPDLTITGITFSNNLINQTGTISVDIKNSGTKSLTNSDGLLNSYFTLSLQNPDWVFDSETKAASLKTSRPLPTASYPLAPGESISRLWLGKFTKAGSYYLEYKVDNGNELDELDENNNAFSTVITVQEPTSNYTAPVSSVKQESISNPASQLLTRNNTMRNVVQEQINDSKYLRELTKGASISTDSKNLLNNFITYGADSNTKKLGAGERAAVIFSFKNAFNRLPTSEVELNDVIKIANGRWPSTTSVSAENKAKEQFKKIYRRAADMNNANDNAAVTIMAYGLKQKAENRNLNSEQAGIKTFKSVYGHTPKTTEEWNIMQAITYSGAKR